MNNTKIHIGLKIRDVLTERGMTITEFAGRINRERTTVYSIFDRKSIDIDLLIKISEALDFDFIHEVYFPKDTKKISSKLLIAVEIEKNDLEGFFLPEGVGRLEVLKTECVLHKISNITSDFEYPA